MSLRQHLIEQITLEGPLSVADYMTQCLLDPRDGYYTQHVRLGADGDFLTAPLVSQMFGEMIGVWLAETWRAIGAPPAFRLVEIGGGDGTLMRDILRVAARVPGLGAAANLVMIEPSQALRPLQAALHPGMGFADGLHDLPTDLPVILIANEVLDCLPARQFVQTEKGWFERRIGLVDDELGFGLVEIGPDFTPPPNVPFGDIIEISLAQMRFGEQIGQVLREATGAALLIDYGRDAPGAGDTLQALHRHKKTDPLAEPGRHDLTMWANFPVVAAAAQAAGARTAITTQGECLHRLGIGARLDALARLHPAQAQTLQRQYERLTDDDQMGRLFKVLGVAFPTTIRLIGVEAGESPL